MALLRPPPPPFASSATAPPVIVYPRTNLFPLLFSPLRPSVRPLAWRAGDAAHGAKTGLTGYILMAMSDYERRGMGKPFIMAVPPPPTPFWLPFTSY